VATDDRDGGEQVTLYSSVGGLALSALSPALLLGLGALGLRGGGTPVVATVLVLVGGALAGVLALSLPISTTFDRGGLHRRCALRSHAIPWEDVVAVERGPSKRRATSMLLRDQRPPADAEAADPDAAPSGGLLARGRGRRRIMLCDQVESREEFDAWSGLVHSLPDGPAVLATRPAAGTVPTDLYRRRRP
jgi:hypothetical protein